MNRTYNCERRAADARSRHSASSAMVRCQVGVLVAFVSMVLMLGAPMAAQVKPGGLITADKASPQPAVTTQRRARSFEVKILRDGKASESVWFADEEASNDKSARKLPHYRAASDGAAADARAPSTVASAPESVAGHREIAAAPLNTSNAPASAPASGSSNATTDRLPTSRTIDVP